VKIVKPSVTYIEERDPYKLIERAGRVCYKSESSITFNSYIPFITNLIKRKHYAMLEHSNIILFFPNAFFRLLEERKLNFKYFNISHADDFLTIVSGSFRAWRELFNKKRDYCFLLMYLFNKYPIMFGDIVLEVYPQFKGRYSELLDISPFYDKTRAKQSGNVFENSLIGDEHKRKHTIHSLHFICDRGVSHELVRHRNVAFAQESTRYCNYSNDRFGNEITCILPSFFDEFNFTIWKTTCELLELRYFGLLNEGATAQQARSILPNSLKTEIIMTANEEEWQHIINLRMDKTAHPQMREVMKMAYEILNKESEGRIVYEG
jgi:thymidylate synthase, flavin-dependent